MPKGLPKLGPSVPGAPAVEMSRTMKTMLQPTDLSKLPIAMPRAAMPRISSKITVSKKESKK